MNCVNKVANQAVRPSSAIFVVWEPLLVGKAEIRVRLIHKSMTTQVEFRLKRKVGASAELVKTKTIPRQVNLIRT